MFNVEESPVETWKTIIGFGELKETFNAETTGSLRGVSSLSSKSLRNKFGDGT